MPPATGDRSNDRGRRPIAIDLFAGAGGLSLGMEQAGFDVVASVEYDPVHSAVHSFNFPLSADVCGDLSALPSSQIEEAARHGAAAHGQDFEQVDAVVGGPPCQGFSTIGKRLLDDERNRLVFHFFRIVTEIRPRYFVMENVPGMRSGGHRSILNRLIEEFEGAGYVFADRPKILNSADFGVPQDRRRLFLIGAREGEPLPEYPSPTVVPVPKRPGAAQAAPVEHLPSGPTVADAIGDLPDLDRFSALIESDEVQLSAAEIDRMNSSASGYARRLRGIDRDLSDRSRRRIWAEDVLTSSTRTQHTAVSVNRFAATAPGETEPVSRFYRLHPAGLCNTLRAGTGSERGAFTSPRPIHPSLPRVLSVREAARLHSFPDWFRLHATKWHGFRQIGNAVAPLVGRAVGAKLAEALDVRPRIPRQRLALGDPSLLTLKMAEAAERFAIDPEAIPPSRQRPSVAKAA